MQSTASHENRWTYSSSWRQLGTQQPPLYQFPNSGLSLDQQIDFMFLTFKKTQICDGLHPWVYPASNSNDIVSHGIHIFSLLWLPLQLGDSLRSKLKSPTRRLGIGWLFIVACVETFKISKIVNRWQDCSPCAESMVVKPCRWISISWENWQMIRLFENLKFWVDMPHAHLRFIINMH